MQDDPVDQRPEGSLALRELAAKTTALRHLGQLLQALPKFTFRMTTVDPQFDELIHLAKHGFPAWPLLQHPGEYTRLTDETMLCRVIEAFHIYLADVVVLARGKTAPRRADLARQIDALASNSGFAEVLAFVTQIAFGAPLEMSGGGYAVALHAVEVRNLILFNKGIVDAYFLKLTGRKEPPVGRRYPIETPEVLEAIGAFEDVAKFIDDTFVERLSLPSRPLFPDDTAPPS
jgi:hypothetical protein